MEAIWEQFEKQGPFEIWRLAGSPSIRNHVASLLRQFFVYCSEKDLLEDPLKFKNELGKPAKLKVAGRKLDHLPTPEEMEELVKQVSYFDELAGNVCAFLGYVGCRLAGAQGLKWENVDRNFAWCSGGDRRLSLLPLERRKSLAFAVAHL
jgi:integrase